MAEADGVFRTDDMTLATLLVMAGHTCKLEALTGRHRKWVNWVFEAEPSIDALVEDYLEGNARVEPREFTDSTAKVRQEMYELIGAPDRRHKTTLRAAPSAGRS